MVHNAVYTHMAQKIISLQVNIAGVKMEVAWTVFQGFRVLRIAKSKQTSPT